MKRLAFAYVLILLAFPIQAQADDPPKPVVPVATVVIPEVQPLIVFADGSISKTDLSWQVVEPAGVPTRVEGRALIIPNPVAGTTYRLALVATGDAPPFAFRFASITAPGAPVVVPTPAPVPGPVIPTPAAIANLRALIVYEADDPVTSAQRAAILSPKIRDYLSAHCVKNALNLPEWRFWDKDVDARFESADWQVAFTKAKADPTPLPKVVVFDGTNLIGVAPVATEADTLTYLQSKGGK